MNTTARRKRLVRTVDLRFFEDDGSGEWGLAHHNTFAESDSYGSGAFNAFWDGRGIFHDVFEHAHEHSEHFRGEAALNVGGEMAAMGALWYYLECLWVSNRIRNQYHSHSTIAINGTIDEVREAVETGGCRYGDRLVCAVPPQKPDEENYLEGLIDEYMAEFAKFEVGKHAEEERHVETCKEYAASVTRESVANLHRWGFREAEKLVPIGMGNANTLHEFIEFWDRICKSHNAEELQNQFRGITFRIYHDRDKLVSWSARLNSQPGSGLPNKLIRSENPVDSLLS